MKLKVEAFGPTAIEVTYFSLAAMEMASHEFTYWHIDSN